MLSNETSAFLCSAFFCFVFVFIYLFIYLFGSQLFLQLGFLHEFGLQKKIVDCYTVYCTREPQSAADVALSRDVEAEAAIFRESGSWKR